MDRVQTPGDLLSAKQRDAEIMVGLARHDESALRDLIDSCARAVYAKALRILWEPQLAEEVTQDTLLILWWDPARFDATKGSIRSFLIGIARFKAIDLVRHEEVIRSRDARLAATEVIFDAPSADRGLEETMVVRAAIAKLPMAKREVIFLAFYRGLTYREVAAILELPEGTVKSRIRDALIKLRTVIAQPGSG